MNRSLLFAFAVIAGFGQSAAVAQSASCKVGLTQDPLVMRIGKDEFRVAFGLDGKACPQGGCNGLIRYNATWAADDGSERTEQRSVAYTIPEGAPRSLTVDRSYFDDGEGHHTTDVVKVDVAQISCESPSSDVARR